MSDESGNRRLALQLAVERFRAVPDIKVLAEARKYARFLNEGGERPDDDAIDKGNHFDLGK